MNLRALPSSLSLKGKRVLVRVDWNIPLHGLFGGEEQLKIARSLPLLKNLHERGAIVLLMTHVGRPKKPDPAFSTKKLLPWIHMATTLPIQFLGQALDTRAGIKDIQERLKSAQPGSLFLLENVRFWKGEEKGSAALAASIASLGDVFINDAFASCHRSHVSVVGLAKHLPVYAGPSLTEEVKALERIISKPKKPFIAVVGGAKLSTKIQVLSALLKLADKVFVGGALAHPFLLAKKHSIGKSLVEQGSVALAKKLLSSYGKKIFLPLDVIVAPSIFQAHRSRLVSVDAIKKTDMIADIGLKTTRAWAGEIAKAQTLVWNGTVGLAEYPDFAHGSLIVAKALASRGKGSCYAVIGGGDTLPLALKSGMSQWIDHLSTGGGAMLEFIAYKGKLPGLKPLMKS